MSATGGPQVSPVLSFWPGRCCSDGHVIEETEADERLAVLSWRKEEVKKRADVIDMVDVVAEMSAPCVPTGPKKTSSLVLSKSSMKKIPSPATRPRTVSSGGRDDGKINSIFLYSRSQRCVSLSSRFAEGSPNRRGR